MSVPLREPWLRNCDWFIICTSVIIFVARSSGLFVEFRTGEDSLFVNGLALCVFGALIVDIIGSGLWMVLTLSTDPFFLEEQESIQSRKGGLKDDGVQKKSALGHEDKGVLSHDEAIKRDSAQSAPQLTTFAASPPVSKPKLHIVEAVLDDESPPSSPFMKISPFNAVLGEGAIGGIARPSVAVKQQQVGVVQSATEMDAAYPAAVSTKALVLDIGSVGVRFGFAGNTSPSLSLMTCDVIKSINASAGVAGDVIASPLFDANGSISNIAHYAKVTKYAFKALHYDTTSDDSNDRGVVDASKHPVVICWPVSCTAGVALELAMTLFEDMCVPSVYFAPAPLLGLYASGRNTGCSVYSGELLTTTLCVVDGIAFKESLVISTLAGKYVSENLLKRLEMVQDGNSSDAPLSVVPSRMKERLVSCSKTRQSNSGNMGQDKDGDSSSSSSPSLSLDERQQCAEGLFRRKGSFLSTDNVPMESLQGTVVSSITNAQKIQSEAPADFWNNIVLSGGNTELPNLKERLENELQSCHQLTQHNLDSIEIHSVPGDKSLAVWLGGSVLGNLMSDAHWVHKGEAEDYIDIKCQFFV
jgi:hypothetical protein